MRRRSLLGTAPLAMLALAASPWSKIGAEMPGKVNFSREILPVLADNCFSCHGPDAPRRKADLRLDVRDSALDVIVPGHAVKSELIARITSADPEERMPPLKSHKTVTPSQVDMLKRWIDEGASWGTHWAFAPLSKPAPPAIGLGNAAPRPHIDAFVTSALARAGLAPAREADRARLIRRVTFDLTGLPPTPAEITAFESDSIRDSHSAFANLVDRLLASPHYGERMATDWLDFARFADTHGYQMDRPRAMWAYRDWVIKAFNENLPFDQFVTWQLAGDLLPNATKEQRLATAFNRLHNQNEEGGIVEEEYRVAYVADRVNTFGTAFLGLTFECARCHDHKFDPITQRDYYSLFAFFQNIDEAGQITFKGMADSMPVPTMLLTTDEEDRQLANLSTQAAAAEEALADARNAASAAFVQWLTQKPAAPTTLAGLVATYRLDAVHEVAIPATKDKPASTISQVANTIEPGRPGKAIESPRFGATTRGPAAELDGENGFTFPDVGHFKRTNTFSLGVWIQTPPTTAVRSVVLHHTKAPVDAGSRGYEILLENGRVSFGLHYLWPGASLKITTRAALKSGEWVHLTATYDGSSRASGARLYINGQLAAVDVIRDGLFKDITYAGTQPDLTVGFRYQDNGFKGGRVRDLAVFGRALTPLESAHLAGRTDLLTAWATPPAQLSAAQHDGLFDYFTSLVHAPTRDVALALRAVCEAQNALVTPLPEAMVMSELSTPKPAYILQRGAYDSPGERVTADTPRALPPFPKAAPRNRLGLARWLTASENPLFARVTVNRLWQQMFGTGLVETSDNFGLQGALPTHPELLDWLAHDFATHGWDVKRTLRQIALSATYRQSSRASPELLARDPQNQLLARGPARRLTAEMLRDQSLAASGLLVEKIGGPSVRPYQRPGLWELIAMQKPKYNQGTGDDLHRRSLYTFWKRTVPPPVMAMFDAAERNVCTVRRQSTSTPLQALALLNDVQIVEAARFIGQRMLKEGGATLSDRLAWAFRLVTGRPADAKEIDLLCALYAEQLASFTADPAATAAFLNFGDTKTDATLPALDLAASATVAHALLNFDESVMRR
ncbi:MAG: DUF1553 domain-containing protein [Opitutaceae bacterium]|nr:DUF1553 domain-containing protein [Opitutaceae bacterium]